MHPPPARQAMIGILACLQIFFVGVIDFLLGPDYGSFVFYFLPIGYAAWRAGRLAGVVISLLSAVIWLLVRNMVTPHSVLFEPNELWNTGIRLLAFLAFGLTFARVRELLEMERAFSRRTLEDVKELSGLLPICASCKKIRDDAGYWQQIESYISTHSRAEFTHGICPECARRLYPEYVGGQREKKEGEEEPPEGGS